MLKNAYLLAKIGADTAENEQHFAKNLRKTDNYPTGPDPVAHDSVDAGLEVPRANAGRTHREIVAVQKRVNLGRI